MAVTTVAFSNLDTWLQNAEENTPETAYELNITGLSVGDLIESTQSGSLGNVIKSNLTKYVDLSATELPSGLTTLIRAFYGCKNLVKPPVIPSGVTSLEMTFSTCWNLIETPEIPNTVTNLASTFEYCIKLKSISYAIPSGVTNMSFTFSGCSEFSVGLVGLPDSVTNMSGTFSNCVKIPSVRIPQNVTDIRFVCDGCISMTSIYMKTVPQNILYTNAFNSCNSVNIIYTDTPYATKNWFNSIYSENTHNFPFSPSKYNIFLYSKTAEIPFSNLSNDIQSMSPNQSPYVSIRITGLTVNNLGSSMTSGTLGYILRINSAYKISLKETVLPSGLTSMVESFQGCEGLVYAPTIPSTVTNLQQAFYLCRSLKEVPDIPENVTNLLGTFYYCREIETVKKIPENITKLAYAFAECTSLKSVELFEVPTSVLTTHITERSETMLAGEAAFFNCTNLTKIGLNESPTSLNSEYYVYHLNFTSNAVSGKVYDKDCNATSITSTSITKSTLKLPLKTDELWFPTGYTDAEIDDIIEDAINYKYSYFNKQTISPKNKSMVIMADDPSNLVTNLSFPSDVSRVGAYCTTAGSVADKVASMQGYTLTSGNTFPITFDEDNTASSALTLNIAGTGAKTIYINGSASSASNHTLNAGTYMCRYNGTNYYIDKEYAVMSARSAGTATNSYNTFSLDKHITCTTAAGTAAKTVSLSGFSLIKGAKLIINLQNANTAASALTLNVNSTGAKTIRWNGSVTSATVYAMTAGYYNCYYDGTYWCMDSSYEAKNARESNTANSCSGNSATATKASVVEGVYTGSGGQQNPQYVGKGQVRFNMMNTPVMGNSNYKNWLMMDCYTGFDVGGVTALGLDRSSLRAFVMRSDAGTSPNRPTTWASSGELLVSSGQSLNSDNGYVVCTNGLKIRWGYLTFSAFAKGTTVTCSSGTFTPAFASNTYKIATLISTTEAGGEMYLTAKNASSFTIKIYNRNSSTTIPAGWIHYIAIGY